MHGEYKVPGGKLMVVNLDTTDGPTGKIGGAAQAEVLVRDKFGTPEWLTRVP